MLNKFRKRLKNKKIKRIFIISIIFILINLGVTIFFTYNLSLLSGIEDVIRYIVICISYLLGILFLYKAIKFVISTKKKKIISFFVWITILISVQGFLGYSIKMVYDPISSINKDEIIYFNSLIVHKDSRYDSVKDLKDIKIGIISKAKVKEEHELATKMIKDNNIKYKEIVEYDDYFEMMNDLYEGDLDSIILLEDFSVMFNNYDKFENIKEDVLVLLTDDMKFKKEVKDVASNKEISKEPFTILLMGVDSEKDGLDKNAAFNGDSLMLITFNPKTLTTTTLSIPRDTYVPIMCFKDNKKNKITHAAWYGTDCMIETIENFTGIDIDYYVKMNFKGVVDLVDAVGGVNVNVPLDFCEQNSDRKKGNKEICLKKGEQHLNGEEALALARHRKTLPNGDIGRGLNQQLVIEGLVNQLTNLSNIDKFNNVLNTVSKNMDTDLSTEEILSFYNIAKDILFKSVNTDMHSLINMQQLHLNGYGAKIYDAGFQTKLWDYVYYESSLEAIVKAMKVNLDLEEPTMIKEFSFDVNETYEVKIIGKNETGGSKISLLPSFIGKDKTYVNSFCNSNNINCSFITISKGNPLYNDNYNNNSVIKQSVAASTEMNKVKSIVFSIIEKKLSDDDIIDDDIDTDIPDIDNDDINDSTDDKNDDIIPDIDDSKDDSKDDNEDDNKDENNDKDDNTNKDDEDIKDAVIPNVDDNKDDNKDTETDDNTTTDDDVNSDDTNKNNE